MKLLQSSRNFFLDHTHDTWCQRDQSAKNRENHWRLASQDNWLKTVLKPFVVLCRQLCHSGRGGLGFCFLVVVFLSSSSVFPSFRFVSQLIINHSCDREHLSLPSLWLKQAPSLTSFTLLSVLKASLRDQHPGRECTGPSVVAVTGLGHSVQLEASYVQHGEKCKGQRRWRTAGLQEGNRQHSLPVGARLIDKMLFSGDRMIHLSVRTSEFVIKLC